MFILLKAAFTNTSRLHTYFNYVSLNFLVFSITLSYIKTLFFFFAHNNLLSNKDTTRQFTLHIECVCVFVLSFPLLYDYYRAQVLRISLANDSKITFVHNFIVSTMCLRWGEGVMKAYASCGNSLKRILPLCRGIIPLWVNEWEGGGSVCVLVYYSLS